MFGVYRCNRLVGQSALDQRSSKAVHFKGERDWREELQVLGMVNVPVNFGSLILTHSFVVVGMFNICILGVDFLKSDQMIVDMANRRLSWATGGVPLIVEITTPTVSIFLLMVQMIPWVELPRQSIVFTQEITDPVNDDHIGSSFPFMQLLMSK